MKDIYVYMASKLFNVPENCCSELKDDYTSIDGKFRRDVVKNSIIAAFKGINAEFSPESICISSIFSLLVNYFPQLNKLPTINNVQPDFSLVDWLNTHII